MEVRICPACRSTVAASHDRCPVCKTSFAKSIMPKVIMTLLAIGFVALNVAAHVGNWFGLAAGPPAVTVVSVGAHEREAPATVARPGVAEPDTRPGRPPEVQTTAEAPHVPVAASSAPPAAQPNDLLKRVFRHRSAVLRLRTNDRDGKPFRSIAAVLVGPNGEAATSYRYLLGAASARVESAGTTVAIDTVLGEDAALDLVIVEIPSHVAAPPFASGGAPAAAGDALVPCATLGPLREETPALGLGAVGRILRDPGNGTTRLPYHGLAAAEGAALLNLDGELLGYVLPGIESASPRFAVPASEITNVLAHPTRLALADWNRARFEGSAEAHRRTAELDLAAGRFAAAIAELRAAIALDRSLDEKLSAQILDAYVRWERAARDAGDLDEALRALEESVQAFPARGELRLRLARGYLERRRFRDAIGAFATSMTPDADAARQDEALNGMADAYSRWADGLYLAGALGDALSVLDEGLRAFPNSAPLRLLRGRILLDRKAFGDAYAELQAAILLSPDLESQVAPLLDAARRALGGGPTVELHFTPGSHVIPADVVLNGRERIVMEVDTGAGLTAISPLVARRLGYDTGAGARVEPVRTASGIVNAAVVTLQSVNVKGLVVRNLQAYVLDLPGSSGLLGLNFLNEFRYSVEPERGVLTLQTR